MYFRFIFSFILGRWAFVISIPPFNKLFYRNYGVNVMWSVWILVLDQFVSTRGAQNVAGPPQNLKLFNNFVKAFVYDILKYIHCVSLINKINFTTEIISSTRNLRYYNGTHTISSFPRPRLEVHEMEPASFTDVTIWSKLEQLRCQQLVEFRLRGVEGEIIGIIVHRSGGRRRPRGVIRFLSGDSGEETGPL